MKNKRISKFFLIPLLPILFNACGFKLDPAPLFPTSITTIEEETLRRNKEINKTSSDKKEIPSSDGENK